ncbi:MAG: thioredoxin domain-containing protein, partial [Actinomycetota bacterium]
MANRLANATSPYLLQHAHNPVDWYQWGDEALERAKREDRPILLSSGYAACHWCHVMERESFEDPQTAALMNQNFVCVKVDREERPDLDSIYMDAVQAMTGHGGWPMTMFCSPEGVPLYGGTYFPPEDRHGLPSFRRVLGAVAAAWKEKRQDLLAQGKNLLDHIAVDRRGEPGSLQGQTVRAAFDALAPAFDASSGGFGSAPKFPQPMNLEFLLRCIRRGFPGAEAMLAATLSSMARGGIYDQIGGGFHRYSVDAVWLVPHFEKMLYDNGALLRIYARAAIALPGDAQRYRQVAAETGEYLLREMRHPAGGLYSSQDADSEGMEGKFYVWSLEELTRAAAGGAEAAARFYGATPLGNWEGANILTSASPGPVPPEIEPARARLFQARAARTHP